MSVVQVFKGTFTVEGLLKSDYKTIFYTKTVPAYGETIGALFDNLVTASIAVANDVFEWTMANKGAEYKFGEDYWQVRIAHPDVRKSLITTTSPEDLENGSGSTVDSVEGVVRYAALIRDIVTHMILGSAQLFKSTAGSELPEKPKRKYSEVGDAVSFQEMAKCGWTGVELDEILQTAVREGRLQASPGFLTTDEVRNVTVPKRKGFWRW